MNLLITGAWKCFETEICEITSLGHTVFFMQDEKGELPVSADVIDGVICNGLFLYHQIEKFTALKYIQLTSAGLDRVPLEYINEKKIRVYNARGVYSVPMSEYAVWGVLSLYKSAMTLYKNQTEHLWNKVRSVMELSGKRVLIVGCGNVGGECAKRFSAMGCTVNGLDVAERYDNDYEKIYSIDKIDELIPQADVIVLTLPYTKENHHIINASRIQKMKSTAVLVNIARGGIIDTDALADALASNKLHGAVLDVFEEEPLSESSPLWDMNNAIITPHNSFVGEFNPERLTKVIMENLKKGNQNA